MRYADPLAQAEIDRLRAENRTLRRGAHTLGGIVDRQAVDICRIAGVPMPDDGDADYELAWSRAAAMSGEIDRLRAKIARAEAIHKPVQEAPEYDPFCVGCWDAGGQDGAPSWPCPTILALRDPEESA